METTITKDGVSVKKLSGTPQEEQDLEKSYRHLCNLRDEVIKMGVMPPIEKWGELNPWLDQKRAAANKRRKAYKGIPG